MSSTALATVAPGTDSVSSVTSSNDADSKDETHSHVPITYMIAYVLLLIFSVFLTMNVYLHIGMLLYLFIVILIYSRV